MARSLRTAATWTTFSGSNPASAALFERLGASMHAEAGWDVEDQWETQAKETFGDLAEHDSDHHDLTTFPRTLAALRELGAVTSQTRVVAIHLGHHNPPTPELTQRLAEWGAEVHDDGAVLTTGPSTTPTQAPHRTLVIGGARSGKAPSLLLHVRSAPPEKKSSSGSAPPTAGAFSRWPAA